MTKAPCPTPGIVPCMPGFVWDPYACRCTTQPSAPPPKSPPVGVPPPTPTSAAMTPWYKQPIVLIAAGGVALYFLLRK